MAGYADYIAAHGSTVLLADGAIAKAIKEERQEKGADGGPATRVRFHFSAAAEGRIGEGDILTYRSRPLRVRRLDFVEDGGDVLTIVAVCDPAD